MGDLRQQSEFLVTHHSFTDGSTLNWGLIRSELLMSAQTTQRTTPLIFLTIMNLCLILTHLAAVCVGSACGTVGEGNFPYVPVSLWWHFTHKPTISRVGMFSSYFVWHVCFVIHFLTSLGLHLCLCHSSTHTCHQFTFHKFRRRSLKLVRPWRPVGLTLWEAAANLSLLVYLLNATLHELRQEEKGRCSFMWVAETHQHL